MQNLVLFTTRSLTRRRLPVRLGGRRMAGTSGRPVRGGRRVRGLWLVKRRQPVLVVVVLARHAAHPLLPGGGGRRRRPVTVYRQRIGTAVVSGHGQRRLQTPVALLLLLLLLRREQAVVGGRCGHRGRGMRRSGCDRHLTVVVVHLDLLVPVERVDGITGALVHLVGRVSGRAAFGADGECAQEYEAKGQHQYDADDKPG